MIALRSLALIASPPPLPTALAGSSYVWVQSPVQQ